MHPHGRSRGQLRRHAGVLAAKRHPDVRSLVLLAGPVDLDGRRFLLDSPWIPVFASAADDEYDAYAPEAMQWREWEAFSRARARRGRRSLGAPETGGAISRRSAGDRPAGRRSAGGSPQQGHRPSRPGARQCQAHTGRQGQGARLRSCEGLGGRRRGREFGVGGCLSFPDARVHRDGGRCHPRHRRVHVARTGARQAGRQASRRVGLRRAAVGDAHRAKAVHWRHHHRRDRGRRDTRAGSGRAAERDAASGATAGGAMSAKGSTPPAAGHGDGAARTARRPERCGGSRFRASCGSR